jgi:hypothetical protein
MHAAVKRSAKDNDRIPGVNWESSINHLSASFLKGWKIQILTLSEFIIKMMMRG